MTASEGYGEVEGEGLADAEAMLWVGGPVLGVLLAESLLFAGLTDAALWTHLLLLLGLAMLPSVVDADVPLVRALALVPLFRLVNLGMPRFVELTIYWFPLIYAPFIPTLYLLRKRQGPSSALLDRRWQVLLVPLTLGLTVGLASLEYDIIRPESLVPSLSAQHLLAITVVMVCFVGFVEELLFRGVLQRTLQTRVGRWPGLFVASGLFGAMHAGYGVPMEVAFAGAIGLVFGLVYDWTDSIALVSVVHGLLNVLLFAVIPLRGPLV